ncbi:hypothetical protein GCM10011352_42970 [Marinobacterium zhoushanense]|uniref:Uncharacterized protein n=1 Tax=Marinobacterium zhoushanense TaxID=1679163 RepID=A0ABQ1KVW9_9GAMM|nr:hypothetical protein [Marinobacterium zhoushanense]GGC11930.1 hypothetical protein GCM10011352_42970 [Marinobacterium zhoushanense]
MSGLLPPGLAIAEALFLILTAGFTSMLTLRMLWLAFEALQLI